MGLEWSAAIAFIKDVWWLLSVPGVVVAAIAMLYLKNQFPTRKQYDEQTKALQAQIGALDDRVDGMEKDLRQLPSRGEVQALGDRIGRVEVEVATSGETIRGVEKVVGKIDHTLTMILDHLLQTAQTKQTKGQSS
jgi:hypothetical protein